MLLLTITSAAIGAGVALLVDRNGNQPASQPAVRAVAANPADDAGSQSSAPPSDTLAAQSSVSPMQVSSQTEPIESAQAAAYESTQAEQEQARESVQSGPDSAPSADTAAQPPVEELEEPAHDRGELQQDQVEPTVMLSPEYIRQGESFSIAVEDADAFSVVATIGSRSWNLQRLEDTAWWGIVALPRDAPDGVARIVVDLYSKSGVWLRSVATTVLVLINPAPLEEIILGGDGAPASPEEVQRDHDVRFVEHIDVSGPPRWAGPWILPVEGEVTGVFGARRSYDGVMSDQWHHGHDIAANHGDPIVAPATGTVVWTGDLVIHGIGVILDHGAGVYSGYWHMSLIAVRVGDEVEGGDWLGNIGSTGLSTGPHLHWEVIVRGVDVDPVQWTGEERPLTYAAPSTTDTS